MCEEPLPTGVQYLHTIDVRSRLSQALLDNLAMAWSRLDRARPQRQEEVPSLLVALDEWMHWAVRIDEELTGALGAAYMSARCERPGGRPIPGLRHAFALARRQGRPLESLVIVTPGSPAVFYDVLWKRYEELPEPEPDPEGEQAYRLHLAAQPARTPASEVTTFLLTTSVEAD
jgi:hypothetical protein